MGISPQSQNWRVFEQQQHIPNQPPIAQPDKLFLKPQPVVVPNPPEIEVLNHRPVISPQLSV
jgi:hypothetical protein